MSRAFLYAASMERWERDDGRYYVIEVTRDLFGPVVLIAHGGATAPRVRSIPLGRLEDAEPIVAEIGRRRIAHGYRRADTTAIPLSPICRQSRESPDEP